MLLVNDHLAWVWCSKTFVQWLLLSLEYWLWVHFIYFGCITFLELFIDFISLSLCQNLLLQSWWIQTAPCWGWKGPETWRVDHTFVCWNTFGQFVTFFLLCSWLRRRILSYNAEHIARLIITIWAHRLNTWLFYHFRRLLFFRGWRCAIMRTICSHGDNLLFLCENLALIHTWESFTEHASCARFRSHRQSIHKWLLLHVQWRTRLA